MADQTQKDPRVAAVAAAEALAAKGEPVTARSVREAAGVQMAVAAEVAREWKARTAATVAVPPVPEVVAARLAGVWAEAVQAARVEHEHAVEGWRAQVEQVEIERDEAISAADELAAAGQRDAAQAATQLAAIQEQLTQQQAAVETLRHDLETAHTERAQAREDAAGARGEATVLREEVTRLRNEIPDSK
ncbi:MAG: DNA-binding protein [Intrasporangium sp.]|uniref:DNA-binding protein n=1 Tax=Intrasporangium sp. TaxID=1925024 RepID=UPI002648EE79|nr:DNA-binding protein [Intrasporangium sp.]MDN5795467.1 DNA-binding protein [Intrasporangium sp.]